MMEAQPSGEITRINRVLHHQDAVGDGDGQRSTAAAFAGNRGDDGNLQARHLAQIVRNGFRLAALFRPQPGIGARRVHEGK